MRIVAPLKARIKSDIYFSVRGEPSCRKKSDERLRIKDKGLRIKEKAQNHRGEFDFILYPLSLILHPQ